MNAQVTDYINNAPDAQRALLQELRELIRQALPAVQEQFKWGRPVFSAGPDVAYLKTAKAYVTLGFFDAARLHEDLHLLDGTGQSMRHIKLRRPADIDRARLTQWLQVLAA
ncbi:DUF1801 domain-containing protein [Hymenobacter edaphi]|uniref:DUF1801 domain-containing protein n=1 Tax=Hymenobacter edaphi TaxID=2211146 RepID=A0A328BJL0_9BACT|nr:DUF1801 domain-containing protein [Hymenobacter edaphi]RAK65158.1 DUF1801 domain-containing protein [Hymenobacter edaphi]